MPPIDPKFFADLLAQELTTGWAATARSNQLPPPGDDWFIWLLLAGRGFGKTRTLSEFVIERVNVGAAKRVALVAATGRGRPGRHDRRKFRDPRGRAGVAPPGV